MGLYGNAYPIGFTGTQIGMTLKQKAAVRHLLEKYRPSAFHHGDCIGADEEAHQIAVSLKIDVVLHPPLNPDKRAFCKGARKFSEKPYLVRNKFIVHSSRLMIAAPSGYEEVLRSGTWSTIRFASGKIPVRLVFPDGTIKER